MEDVVGAPRTMVPLKLFAAAATEMLLDVECVPALFATLRLTVKLPTPVKVWLGFFRLLVDPSPKFQVQFVGEPVEVSVNCTI